MKQKPYETDDPVPVAHLAGMNLKDKTLGIVGLGMIGKRVAQIAQGFGMNVIAHTDPPETIDGVTLVPFEELLQKSDVISLHVPLDHRTKQLIGVAELALMKPNALLINTARGQHIDNQALADALKNNELAGAGLDLLENVDIANPLLECKDKIVLTPHSAWLSNETLQQWAENVTKNVEAFVKGTPINVLN